MKKILPAFTICFLLAVTSCSKDEQFNNYPLGHRGPEFRYTEWTRLVEEIHRNEDGNLISHANWTYDNNGRLIEYNLFKIERSRYGDIYEEKHRDFVYDGLNCSYVRDYYYDGKLWRTNRFGVEFYDASFIMEKLAYQKIIYGDGTGVVRETFYTYDSEGRPLYEESKYNDGETVHYIEYNDHNGNSVNYHESGMRELNTGLDLYLWGDDSGNIVFYDNQFLPNRVSHRTVNNSFAGTDEHIYTYDEYGREIGMVYNDLFEGNIFYKQTYYNYQYS